MHSRTAELRKIITDNKMSSKDVAALVSVSENTVNCWRSTIRVIPAHRLEILKLKMESGKC